MGAAEMTPGEGRRPRSGHHEDRLTPRSRSRSRGTRRRRGAFLVLALAAVLAVALLVTLFANGGSTRHPFRGPPAMPVAAHARSHRSASNPAGAPGAVPAGRPGDATVPILMYHVINPPPAGAPFPGLYVDPGEFAAQMRALRAAGFHAVTMEQVESNWRDGTPLPPGKPIVLSFDNGYQSQYTEALPVLRSLGWVGVENIQLSGLPPSQGGMSEAQVRGLIASGWELDTQGYSHAELTALSPSALHFQVASARQTLRRRYGVPVNWFCYPSGHYDATVVAEVKAAGYLGSTTVVPGWASRGSDPYRLPRLRVLGGTGPQALLSLIEDSEHNSPPPPSYT